MAKISLNIKEPLKAWFFEKANIVTGWNETVSDERVPSEVCFLKECTIKI